MKEAFEAEFLLEHIGKEVMVAAAFDAIPTAVGGHDRGDARINGGFVSGEVNAAKSGFVDFRIALIEGHAATGSSPGGASVGKEMLGCGDDGERVIGAVTLKAADFSGTKRRGDIRLRREAFIGSAPADVLWCGDAGSEGPVDVGGTDFFRGDAGDFFDEAGIARAAKARCCGERGWRRGCYCCRGGRRCRRGEGSRDGCGERAADSLRPWHASR